MPEPNQEGFELLSDLNAEWVAGEILTLFFLPLALGKPSFMQSIRTVQCTLSFLTKTFFL
jgi:hypothetical protein